MQCLCFLRLALLLQLCVAVGATYIVEQPRGSLLFEHDRLSELVDYWRGTVDATCHHYILLAGVVKGFHYSS